MKKAARGVGLGPPESGPDDYWVLVHVRLFSPLASADASTLRQLHGYYRNLGIRSAPNRIQLHAAEAIDDGTIDWSDSEWNLVDPSSLDATVRSRITPVTPEGVWYTGGRLFYSDSDDESEAVQDSTDASEEDRPQ